MINTSIVYNSAIYILSIALVESGIFGSNGERYIRISLCAKEEMLEAALHRIEELKN